MTVDNDHIYTFPESYDGSTPFPLLVGFHACGNPIDQFINLTRGSAFETEYVRAVGRSSDSGGCWNYNNDIAKVLRIHDDLMDNYCIDMDRVFATGHSSGAQMIVQILTHKSDADHMNFRAVAPVAASDYGALQVPMPAMYIQGKNDTVRGGDGASTVARFRTANMCEMSSTPYSEVMGCQSSGRTVNPGCISYTGCSEPTIWCSHDDPAYSNTSHGVPCFAIQAMYDFFADVL
ncbi:alpha/beta hydrolase family esterase [Sorangium sp. So ce1128]